MLTIFAYTYSPFKTFNLPEQFNLLIVERFCFYQCNQAAGESVHNFLADLKRLVITCEFEDFLNQALRDHFVCGLRAEGMQKRLLTEPYLNIAQGLEY